jgi:hypothetical protein
MTLHPEEVLVWGSKVLGNLYSPNIQSEDAVHYRVMVHTVPSENCAAKRIKENK